GGTTLYLHVFNWPKDGKLVFNDFSNKVKSCQLLESGGTLKTKRSNGTLEILIPQQMPNPIATVIKLDVAGSIGTPEAANPSKKMKTGALD
ncbi:MAG: alpha-L-fucosidase, partial [Bacteroidia bacterium]|nr:alpha-L-fucosidase [Bacteroidia bacterium]